uniref:F-box domain-containing protein n=1 Tax=Ditylenchus dipsaci TaxID=166011 RepID=A0A915EGT4_9BILA
MSTFICNSSAEVLFEVLSFLNRSELDDLALTSKHLNHFTAKNFSAIPLNYLDTLYITTNYRYVLKFCNCHTSSCKCSLEQLQCYSKSGKWIVKCVFVTLRTKVGLNIAKWEKEIESICSLWLGSRCVIHVERGSVAALDFQLYPLLYNCAQIEFSTFQRYGREVDLLSFLENIPNERQNKLVVQIKNLNDWDIVTELLFRAKQSFDAAESQCSYRLQFTFIPMSMLDQKTSFKMTNERTRESLRYHMDRRSRKHAILERYSV